MVSVRPIKFYLTVAALLPTLTLHVHDNLLVTQKHSVELLRPAGVVPTGSVLLKVDIDCLSAD